MRKGKECDLYRGRSKAECERYGKPCINAHYTGKTAYSYEMETGARCVVCGKPATDVHHWPPLGKSHHGEWCLQTPNGWHVLRPSLIALCRKCHERFHLNQLTANWVWDSAEHETAYWEGRLTKQRIYMPHSPNLYQLGQWVFTDRETDKQFYYREGVEDGFRKAVRGAFHAEPEEPAGRGD